MRIMPRPANTRVRLAAALIALGALAACSGSPPGPTPPPPQLSIQCPAPMEVPSLDGVEAVIGFSVPVPTGGNRPSASCAPGPGSRVPVGETTVNCTASDLSGQSAACSFIVRVTAPPRIQFTRFVAFGDSITEGVVSPAPGILRRVDAPHAYPSRLRGLLAERYTAQEIVVINRGIAGEELVEGRDRLPDVVDEDKPEVLLLLEGINNIRNVQTDVLEADLRSMIRTAQRRGAQVVVSQLLPVSAQREGSRPGTQAAILAFNQRIRRTSRELGLGEAVDLHTPFVQEPSLLGQDGLHPTEAGYVRIAEIFFAAIRERWDRPPSPPSFTPLIAPPSAARR
jgi:lysophospholipase L1-like esterase